MSDTYVFKLQQLWGKNKLRELNELKSVLGQRRISPLPKKVDEWCHYHSQKTNPFSPLEFLLNKYISRVIKSRGTYSWPTHMGWLTESRWCYMGPSKIQNVMRCSIRKPKCYYFCSHCFWCCKTLSVHYCQRNESWAIFIPKLCIQFSPVLLNTSFVGLSFPRQEQKQNFPHWPPF